MNGVVGVYCASEEQQRWIQEYRADLPSRIYNSGNCLIKCFYPPGYENKYNITYDVQPGKDMIVFGEIFPDGREGTISQWADDSSLHTFDGEFIRIIVNHQDQEIKIAIDQNYVTPFFYALKERSLVFSSYMPAVHALIGSPRSMSERAVFDFLAYGYCLGEDTFFSDIKKLRTGHGIRYNKDGLKCYQYFSNDITPNNNPADENEVMSSLITATKLRLNNTNVAVALSGGMDSRFMLGLLKNQFPEHDVLAYMYSQKDSEELAIAKSASRVAGVKLHPVILEADDFIRDFDKCCSIHGGNDYVFQSFLLHTGETLMKLTHSVVTGYCMDLTFGATFATPQLTDGAKIKPEAVFNAQRSLKSEAFTYQELLGNARISVKDYQIRIYDEFCIHRHDESFLQIQSFILSNRVANLVVYRDFITRQYVEFIYPGISTTVRSILNRVPFEVKKNHDFYRKLFIKNFEELAHIKYFNTGLPITADTDSWRNGLDAEARRDIAFDKEFYENNKKLPYRKYFSDYDHWVSSDYSWIKIIEESLSNGSPLCCLVLDGGYLRGLLEAHIAGKANNRKKLLTAVTLDRVMRYYKINKVVS
jgi:hypothetical protein